MLNDELDEMNFGNMTRSYIFDISDIDALIYNGFYQSNNPSIDHNLYMRDQFTYESNYTSGVRVLDNIRMNEGQVGEVAYFDLYPVHDNPIFEGTWSNYPFLPSGLILATSMYDGIFIIRPNFLNLSESDFHITCADSVIQTDIQVNADLYFPLQVSLNGLGSATISGQVIESPGVYSVSLQQLADLGNGMHNGTIALVSANGQSYELPISVVVSETGSLPELAPNSVQVNQIIAFSDMPAALFSWQAEEPLTSYLFEISSQPDFLNLEFSQAVNGASISGISLPSGSYFWRVGTPGGCWSEVYPFTVDSPNSLHENQAKLLSIFPNPGRDVIHVYSEGMIGNLKITDTQGKTWIQHNVLNSKVDIDTVLLPRGVYFIRSHSDTRCWIKL